LRKEEFEAVMRGCSEALAKSSARALLFGCEIDWEEVPVGFPTNWAAKSLYCVCKLCSVSARVSEALFFNQTVNYCPKILDAYDVSPASSNRSRSFATLSTPSRNDSRERDM